MYLGPVMPSNLPKDQLGQGGRILPAEHLQGDCMGLASARGQAPKLERT